MVQPDTTPRRFLVRGSDLYGLEMSRAGDHVTLNISAPWWPFPFARTFDRSQLVLVAGREAEQPQSSST